MRARRRRSLARRELTRAERRYLLSGQVWTEPDGTRPFSRLVDGLWLLDETRARAAWRRHRDTLGPAYGPDLMRERDRQRAQEPDPRLLLARPE